MKWTRGAGVAAGVEFLAEGEEEDLVADEGDDDEEDFKEVSWRRQKTKVEFQIPAVKFDSNSSKNLSTTLINNLN